MCKTDVKDGAGHLELPRSTAFLRWAMLIWNRIEVMLV